MKHSAEFVAFAGLVDRVLAVPREEILRREAEYKKQAQQNPTKRGPKRKTALKPPSASPGPRA